MNFKFEKIPSPIYPVFLHVGEYSIPIEPERIQSLKGMIHLDATKFFEGLIQKIGTNRYLKELIQEGIQKAEDKEILAKRLEEEIRGL